MPLRFKGLTINLAINWSLRIFNSKCFSVTSKFILFHYSVFKANLVLVGYIVNKLHASVTPDRVTKLVCIEDWLKSMDWVCELNNDFDFSNTTDCDLYEFR